MRGCVLLRLRVRKPKNAAPSDPEAVGTPFFQARFPWLAPATASVYYAKHALLGSKKRPHL